MILVHWNILFLININYILQILRRREAEAPRDIEDQLEELHSIVRREQGTKIKEEDICRLVHLRQCIDDFQLEPYDYYNFDEIRKRIVGRLRKRSE